MSFEAGNYYYVNNDCRDYSRVGGASLLYSQCSSIALCWVAGSYAYLFVGVCQLIGVTCSRIEKRIISCGRFSHLGALLGALDLVLLYTWYLEYRQGIPPIPTGLLRDGFRLIYLSVLRNVDHIRGLSTDCRRTIRGLSTECPRTPHGLPMYCPWPVRGASVRHPWSVRG